MQWNVFLLILMGQWSFFTCHLHEYTFIKMEKTWSEAQRYCRDKHTDLATVSNMEDMESLRQRAEEADKAWIGLRYGSGNKMWHWSMPGVEFNESEAKWRDHEPNDVGGKENCVVRMITGSWVDISCRTRKHFFCYDEKNRTSKFHFAGEKKFWQEAQTYCRQTHTDIVSGTNQVENQDLIRLMDDLDKQRYWLGLFRDRWTWSDGSRSSFRHWKSDFFDKEPDDKECAVIMLGNCGRWETDDCDSTKPFFCYDDKVILINQNKTWTEALYYCRENYKDLVSITNCDEQMWVQEKAKEANSPYVWLGLRYTCTLGFWLWVSDEVVGYNNWASGEERKNDCDMSGAIDRGGQHKWFKNLDNLEFNFICSKF